MTIYIHIYIYTAMTFSRAPERRVLEGNSIATFDNFHLDICHDPSSELSRRDGLIEGPQHKFHRKQKDIPESHSNTCLKWPQCIKITNVPFAIDI